MLLLKKMQGLCPKVPKKCACCFLFAQVMAVSYFCNVSVADYSTDNALIWESGEKPEQSPLL